MAIVVTANGNVEGVLDNGIEVYWGIPYSKPPIDKLRFRAPEPPVTWSGTRLADRPGAASLQSDHPLPGFSAKDPRDEDCLFLNVFTPASDNKARPVMVWVHSGGYTHGVSSENLYSGVPLALRGDVVVVSINYRLGALGFLHLGEHIKDKGTASNLGLLDCVAALKWVQENISSFGGDTNNVTIFGESAGASAVGSLLALPAATGLFKRAILQSGQGHARGAQFASAVVDDILKDLGLEKDQAEELLSISADDIVAAQTRVSKGGFIFGPVLDKNTLPQQPLAAILKGSADGVDLLIGNNRDESKLFRMGGATRKPLSDDALIREINPLLPALNNNGLQKIVDVYRASRQAKGLSSDNLDLADAIIGDQQFRIGGVALAQAHAARGGNSFMYLFTHESPARGGSLGSCHALEMPFVFGTIDQPEQVKFAGNSDHVRNLSHNMMDSWIAFAYTGNPSHKDIGMWPAYDESSRATMIFGDIVAIENDPFSEERKVLSR